LNLTAPDDSVAEYSFTGIDTRPKLKESDAMERAAMGTFLVAVKAADGWAVRREVNGRAGGTPWVPDASGAPPAEFPGAAICGVLATPVVILRLSETAV
jgi:hypothetical protein